MPPSLGLCRRIFSACSRPAFSALYGRYGFRDAFNPGFRDTSARVETGNVDATHGWVATDWLGIDEGPILAMLANYRNDAVWRVIHRSANIRRGLIRAGFTGGWLA